MTFEELKEEAKKMGYVQITGFPNYFINRNGEIMNKHFKKIKQTLSFQGYWKVGLWKNGKVKRMFVHRIIGEEFIPNPQNCSQINHKNGIRTDNSIDNLEWVTPLENNLHKIRVLKSTGGLVKKGQTRKNHPAAKKVFCKELNRVFDCTLDVRDTLGISRFAMYEAMRDGRPVKGYTLSFVKCSP